MAGYCECGNEPSGSIKCGKIFDRGPVSFSGRTLLHGFGWSYLVGHLGCEVGRPKAYTNAKQRQHKRLYYVYSLR